MIIEDSTSGTNLLSNFGITKIIELRLPAKKYFKNHVVHYVRFFEITTHPGV